MSRLRIVNGGRFNPDAVDLNERERIEAWQRERENRYRIAKGLPPLKAGDEIPEGKDSVIPDAALEESARIVADLIVLGGAGGTLVMSR